MQIANVTLYNATTGTTDGGTLVPDFARKGEASWFTSTLPEVGRKLMTYTRRPPVKGTELVKHSFRVTLPTLKSVVTDPEGPFAPNPTLDYPNVVELSVWVHPRSTAAEREAAAGAFLNPTATLKAAVVDAVVNGNSFY